MKFQINLQLNSSLTNNFWQNCFDDGKIRWYFFDRTRRFKQFFLHYFCILNAFFVFSMLALNSLKEIDWFIESDLFQY